MTTKLQEQVRETAGQIEETVRASPGQSRASSLVYCCAAEVKEADSVSSRLDPAIPGLAHRVLFRSTFAAQSAPLGPGF